MDEGRLQKTLAGSAVRKDRVGFAHGWSPGHLLRERGLRDDLESGCSSWSWMAKQGQSAGKRGPVEAAALFPRLHVSHAKRDNGPRPPPRNKMALYEQVTLQPSHQKVAGASGASAPSLQEEGPGASGMQAPKARSQPDGSLPSMVSSNQSFILTCNPGSICQGVAMNFGVWMLSR